MTTQRFNKEERDRIFRRVRQDVILELTRTSRPDGVIDPAYLAASCLEWAWWGYQRLRELPGSPRVLIQAGSASWPRVAPHLDDGVSSTHFSYEWDTKSPLASLARLGIHVVMGQSIGYALPEMHCWLGLPETQEIIDFTTGLWPEACYYRIGEPWLADRPPEYLWVQGKHLPQSVRYHADPDAIDLAILVLARQGRQYPCVPEGGVS